MIDFVGIGAINIDYIFSVKHNDFATPAAIESGSENLSSLHNFDSLKRMLLRDNYKCQIGGSALLTTKTISSLNNGLTTAYVGCYGTPGEIERMASIGDTLDSEFDFLTCRDWLFKSSSAPGRAIVKLYNGQRLSIDINPGANNDLEKMLLAREAEFIAFLASARWVHLTSLADVNQFEYIVTCISQAKESNPQLRFSVDPGFEYTKDHPELLQKCFPVADYIFLNSNELSNILGDGDFQRKTKIDHLGNLVKNKTDNDTLVFVHKGKARNVLINFINGHPYSRSFWHPVLSKVRIHNDTGAGDVFAGGLIAGLLSKHMLTHQPAPVRLGARLAAERLSSHDFPATSIRRAYEAFITENLKNESDNFASRAQAFWEKWGEYIIGFVLGIVSSVIVSLIFAFF